MRLTCLFSLCLLFLVGCSGERDTGSGAIKKSQGALSVEDARAVHFNVKEATSPKGVKFWYVNIPDAPVIAVNFSIKNGGDAYDPEDKTGVGNFLAEMLNKGSKKLNEKELQAFLEDHAAGFGASCRTDNFSFSLTSLKEDFDEVVEVISDLFRNPRFDPKDLQFIKEQEVTSLALRKSSMRYQLSKIVKKTLFADHPYSRVMFDSPEEINRITIEDLREKLSVMRHTGAEAVIVGPVGEKEAADYLDKIIPDSALSSTDVPAEIPMFTLQDGNGTDPIIVPERVPQATALIVLEGITLKSKDALAAQLLLKILDRRLWSEVREKRGLAYVVNAYPNRMEKGGTIQITLGTDKRQVSQAIGVVKEVIRRLYEEGVTSDELKTFVRMAEDAHPMAFTTTTATASVLHGYQLQGRSYNYVNNRFRKLQQMTTDKLNSLAKKYLNPDRAHIFIHGIPEN